MGRGELGARSFLLAYDGGRSNGAALRARCKADSVVLDDAHSEHLMAAARLGERIEAWLALAYAEGFVRGWHLGS